MSFKKALQKPFWAILNEGRQLDDCQRRVLKDDDSDLLHDLRGHLLRLDFFLTLFKKILQPVSRSRLKRKLKIVRRLTGDVRALDIVAQYLKEQKRLKVSNHQMSRAKHSLTAHKDIARKKLVRVLSRRRFGYWSKDTHQIIPSLKSLKQNEQSHHLRITFKGLRYVAEFFEQCYGARLSNTLSLIIGVQDRLGKRQDRRSVRRLLKEKKPLNNPSLTKQLLLSSSLNS